MSGERRRARKSLRRLHGGLDQLRWKAVDTGTLDLGHCDDALFFGLEEVDGQQYLRKRNELVEEVAKSDGGNEDQNVLQVEGDLAPSSKKKKTTAQDDAVDIFEKPKNRGEKTTEKRKKDKEKKKTEKKKSAKTEKKPRQENHGSKQADVVEDVNEAWGETSSSSVRLHSLLVEALHTLHFNTPTPIQSSAIPRIIEPGNDQALADVVGSAETGSGKTLAFGLPILHSLMHCWNARGNLHKPFALILAPTRELAMQITSVLSDICRCFRDRRRVEVVNVIGGLSEHKQRRQLSTSGKPCHIIVATPGRLCDMLGDEDAGALQDMSSLRYLVVDEADRMMDDGHFPELFKIFGRVIDHEKLAAKGLCPIAEAKRAREGTDFDDVRDGFRGEKGINEKFNKEHDDDNIEEFDMDEQTFHFDAFPSEEQLQLAKNDPQRVVPFHLREDSSESEEEAHEEIRCVVQGYIERQRQTLLFSATAIHNSKQTKKKRTSHRLEKSAKDNNTHLTKLGIPSHICQLLKTVGIQKNTLIADVIANNSKQLENDSQSKMIGNKRRRSDGSEEKTGNTVPLLPQGLQQWEVRVTTEDKDVMAYFYLLKNIGRTLIFVNSIKTARRLDGLLRALGLNCRCIHAQLQQKQRIKALESFVASPVGILVATDVAARGLDLPKIQHVIHYDISRSPQVYIHRSGRTARAGQKGVSLSIVAPEDTDYHKDICDMMQVRSLPLLKGINLSSVPVVKERVKLAKKIFLQTFVSSQSVKEQNWLKQSAKDTDLVVDDMLLLEMSNELDTATGGRKHRDEKEVKKSLDADRARLKRLLNEPLEDHNSKVSNRQKRAFVVVAK